MSDEPSHRIEIVRNPHRVRIIHQGITYADSHGALTLLETGLPDVHYLPRADVNMTRLIQSDHVTHCPYKGAATHFHLHTEDGIVENVAWSYEAPFETAQPIAQYVAFYTSRIDRIDVTS